MSVSGPTPSFSKTEIAEFSPVYDAYKAGKIVGAKGIFEALGRDVSKCNRFKSYGKLRDELKTQREAASKKIVGYKAEITETQSDLTTLQQQQTALQQQQAILQQQRTMLISDIRGHETNIEKAKQEATKSTIGFIDKVKVKVK